MNILERIFLTVRRVVEEAVDGIRMTARLWRQGCEDAEGKDIVIDSGWAKQMTKVLPVGVLLLLVATIGTLFPGVYQWIAGILSKSLFLRIVLILPMLGMLLFALLVCFCLFDVLFHGALREYDAAVFRLKSSGNGYGYDEFDEFGEYSEYSEDPYGEPYEEAYEEYRRDYTDENGFGEGNPEEEFDEEPFFGFPGRSHEPMNDEAAEAAEAGGEPSADASEDAAGDAVNPETADRASEESEDAEEASKETSKETSEEADKPRRAFTPDVPPFFKRPRERTSAASDETEEMPFRRTSGYDSDRSRRYRSAAEEFRRAAGIEDTEDGFGYEPKPPFGRDAFGNRRRTCGTFADRSTDSPFELQTEHECSGGKLVIKYERHCIMGMIFPIIRQFDERLKIYDIKLRKAKGEDEDEALVIALKAAAKNTDFVALSEEVRGKLCEALGVIAQHHRIDVEMNICELLPEQDEEE